MGLEMSAVNENQGAESVASFLLALLAMLGLVSDGLERGDDETDMVCTD